MVWTNYTRKIDNNPAYPILQDIYSGIWDGTPGTQGSLPGLDNLNYLNIEFDDISDASGTVNWTTNQLLGTAAKDTVFTLLRVNGNLNIANNVLVTTQTRKLGLGILVTGHLTFGSGAVIDMSAKGANHRGRNQTGGEDSGFAINYPSRNIRLIEIASGNCLELNTTSPYAQNGSTFSNPSLTNINGLGGTADISPTAVKFGTGGGGRGSSASAAAASPPNGFGAAGSTFCGGAGGGGRAGTNTNAESGFADGGAGGRGSTSFDGSPSGGGAGNLGGFGRTNAGADIVSTRGSSGAGGVLILIVLGNITFNGSTIRSNGSNGATTNVSARGDGGGSGGGNISIFVQGTISGTSTLQANGGSCSAITDTTTRIAGQNGANGSINLYKVSGLTL